VGLISRDVFGFTDPGLPVGGKGAHALLPGAVAAFASGISVPLDEVRLFLAAREAAHSRLFSHVPWLVDHLFGAVETYASGITIDMSRLEEAVRSVDPNDPESLRQAMTGGVFDLELSPAQRAALSRLETALALVEGWVDVVTAQAVARNLPDVEALREMILRRRAEGGPSEKTFATLVGLELRPRRARDATRLWTTITERVGPVERDTIWSHPDFIPTAEDLSAPDSFFDRRQAQVEADAEVDAAIEALLDQSGQETEAPGDAPDAQGEPGADGPKA
jgi:putative hydrolase